MSRDALPSIVGLYAWTVSVLFGAVLLDVAYAGQSSGSPDEGRDLLLAISALAIILGALAVTVAWARPTAGILLVVSLTLAVAELLVPVLVSGVVLAAGDAIGVRVGPWIRLIGSGAMSVLAFAGWWAAIRGASGEV